MPSSTSKNTMDMCHGPLMREIIFFAFPLFCSTLLQLTFTSADNIVVGRFASPLALAAVGATSSVTTFIITFFMGISVGANVLVANYYGSRQLPLMRDSVYAALSISLIGGILLATFGISISRYILQLMKTPPDILDKAVLYMRIYFGGMPFIMLYNYGSAVLRALGDTKRPLYYLTLAGVINVVLNLIFVICLKMDADGVATATVISQSFSAILVWRAIVGINEIGSLHLRDLRLRPDIVRQIIKVGLPVGLQNVSFSFANVIIQSSINSFGALAVAGNTAATNIEALICGGSNSFHYTAISFSGQLYGGKAFARMKKFVFYCLGMALVVVLTMAATALYFGPQLMTLFTEDPAVVDWGMQRMRAMFYMFGLHTIMQVFSGTLRGMGRTLAACLIVLVFACLFRVLWILCIFPLHRTMFVLLQCFPASWLLVSILSGSYLYYLFKTELRTTP